MTELNQEIFCHCFGCERPIKVGERVHSITYTRETIVSSNAVQPDYGEGLGTWCSPCFSELLKKGSCDVAVDCFINQD